MIKLFDTFAWIWGFHLALEKAIWKENIELIGFSEIDKFAKQTYLKNFPGSKDFWDITKIDFENLPDFDLLTWGFPCQDVSVAGKQNLEGGRTILVEYLLKILEIKKPKYFVFENVKGLMSSKFDTFRNSIFERIKEAWYSYKYKILNTKDFWIPQNRERVFIVWKYNTYDNPFFDFPDQEPLKIFLEDLLEKEVEEKFFISNETFEKLKAFESNARLYEKIAPTLNTMQGWHRQPKILTNVNPSWRWQNWNVYFWDTSPTITTNKWEGIKIFNNSFIRKLTPLECERLQGFPDNWTFGVSNSQRYKQCWNAISVNVVEKIFKNLFKD